MRADRKRLRDEQLQIRVRRLFRRDREIDWFRLLVDLQYAGINNTDVARILCVPESNVRNNWKRGGCPNYEDGAALVKLHRLVMTLKRERLKNDAPAISEHV